MCWQGSRRRHAPSDGHRVALCFWASLYAVARLSGIDPAPPGNAPPMDPVALCRELGVALQGHSGLERQAVLAVWTHGERMIRDVEACRERTLAEVRVLRERLAYLNALNHTLASLAGVRPRGRPPGGPVDVRGPICEQFLVNELQRQEREERAQRREDDERRHRQVSGRADPGAVVPPPGPLFFFLPVGCRPDPTRQHGSAAPCWRNPSCRRRTRPPCGALCCSGTTGTSAPPLRSTSRCQTGRDVGGTSHCSQPGPPAPYLRRVRDAEQASFPVHSNP